MEHAAMKTARELVIDYYADTHEGHRLTYSETFVVWFCKTLQNWKAIVSTTHGGLYEITHNGDTGETYLDAYEKKENRVYVDGE